MKKHDVQQLRNGIYRLHWRDGTFTVAAVGSGTAGLRWMAPLNFSEPMDERDSVRWWIKAERAELLVSVHFIQPGTPGVRCDVACVHELFPYMPRSRAALDARLAVRAETNSLLDQVTPVGGAPGHSSPAGSARSGVFSNH